MDPLLRVRDYAKNVQRVPFLKNDLSCNPNRNFHAYDHDHDRDYGHAQLSRDCGPFHNDDPESKKSKKIELKKTIRIVFSVPIPICFRLPVSDVSKYVDL